MCTKIWSLKPNYWARAGRLLGLTIHDGVLFGFNRGAGGWCLKNLAGDSLVRLIRNGGDVPLPSFHSDP